MKTLDHSSRLHRSSQPRQKTRAGPLPMSAPVSGGEVAFFVLTGTSKGTFYHYDSRAVESMRTWARAFPLTWFVLPDNAISQAFVSRPQYGRRRRRVHHRRGPVRSFADGRLDACKPRPEVARVEVVLAG